MPSSQMTLGQRGEQIAAHRLQECGYAILHTNWRCAGGEIDIVARHDDTLVFVEVKTRRAATTGDTLAAITPAKRHRLIRAAHAYLEAHGTPDAHWRIDAIAVTLSSNQPPVIDHVQDALDW